MKNSFIEMENLAMFVLGWGESDFVIAHKEPDYLDRELDEKFGVDFEGFCAVADALLMLTPTMKSPFNKKSDDKYHAFIKSYGDKNKVRMIVRAKAE